MVKDSYKCGHDVTHYLLEDTSESIPVEFEPGHEENGATEGNHYINLFFKKPSLLS